MSSNRKGFERDLLEKLLEIGKEENIKNKYYKNLKKIRKDVKLHLKLGLEGIILKDYKNFKFNCKP